MREILVKYEIIFVGVSFTINTTSHGLRGVMSYLFQDEKYETLTYKLYT